VRAWAALRASSVEGRFEALHAAGLTALVGREEELELLLRRWSQAKTGEGQVVLLSGEAGIGKSRLTAALLERLASEPHTREAGAILRRRHRLRGSCSRRRVREDAACMTSHAARCPTFLYAVQKAVIVGHRKRCGECKAEPNENGNIYEKG